MKKMWHPDDRVTMPSGRPGIIERIYRERGTDLHRMEVRYTDTLKVDIVDVRVDLPRIKEQRGF